MSKYFVFLTLIIINAIHGYARDTNASPADSLLVVKKTADFKISGTGDHANWQKTSWTALQKLDKAGQPYTSRFKILYSAKGIYVLFNGEDAVITSPFSKDFEKIFKGDVFEVFFHPKPDEPIYFEYEVSPLDKELVLLMVSRNGYIGGWSPWPYEAGSRVEKKVTINGGVKKNGASVKAWTAELFIPYKLLGAFENTPAVKGAIWKANFCRLDYDTGTMVKWAWAPIETSFHETSRYFSLKFD